MIPSPPSVGHGGIGKPRASGDDPGGDAVLTLTVP